MQDGFDTNFRDKRLDEMPYSLILTMWLGWPTFFSDARGGTVERGADGEVRL